MRVSPLWPRRGNATERWSSPTDYFATGPRWTPRRDGRGWPPSGQGLFLVTLARREARAGAAERRGAVLARIAPSTRRAGGSPPSACGRRFGRSTSSGTWTSESGEVRTWRYRDSPGASPWRRRPWAPRGTAGCSWAATTVSPRLGAGGQTPRSGCATPGRLTLWGRRTPDGRWLAPPWSRPVPRRRPFATTEVVIFDLTKGTRSRDDPRVGRDHGGVRRPALGSSSPATPAGVVRVGPPPARRRTSSSATPRRSTAWPCRPTGGGSPPPRGSEIRLWPMPDLSRPPLHTLPHDELLAKLRRAHQPARRRGPRLAHRLEARPRPLPRLEGRADVVIGLGRANP